MTVAGPLECRCADAEVAGPDADADASSATLLSPVGGRWRGGGAGGATADVAGGAAALAFFAELLIAEDASFSGAGRTATG